MEVTFEKGVLCIRGEQGQGEDGKKYYRQAFSQFSYRVAVPGEIDGGMEPEAVCKNGVMKVTFQKKISVKAE